MKNLLINKDFMQYTACMDAWDLKLLLGWLYDYAVDGKVPTNEDWDKAPTNVCVIFNKYFPYIDYCNSKYDTKVKQSEFTDILEVKEQKKKSKKKPKETEEGNFVGKVKPNDKF